MLSITGGKGGTGKTTTTLGLARVFAARGRPVLAVDADWDLPDLGALAGVPRRTAFPDGAGVVDAARDATEAVPGDAREPVRVLPAPERPAERDPGRVFRAIAAETDAGTAVLVDCPAGAAPDAVAPVRAADRALLLSEACTASLRDAAKIAAVARRVDTPVAGAVVTRATVVPSGVGDLLGCRVVACVPRLDEPATASRRARSAHREIADGLTGDRESVKSRRTA
ncbi:MinD/ParA family ATP-binding protein [Halobaculum lipolyticum]|uniref:MinD/ParA family protein n=1 Tax=Halobaculum lipolyticum TaxID=3032001 RepID=A0ABD5WII0_9EURY|nr:AAA family ATPase [Halobaculum sp. DT31]